MNSKQLRQLISQPEGLKLDFKRELHKLKHSDKDYAKQQRDEFIRDILSLTNGNVNTAEQKGYLIAEPLFIKALKIRESCLGKDHIQVKNSLNNLVAFYLKQERYSEAEPLMRRLLPL